MALSNRWIGLGLAIVAFGSALSGCSKEGGYSTPDKIVAAANTTQGGTDKDVASVDLRITTWGPEGTKAGTAFNAQPDGSAALWVQVNQSLEGSDSVVTMDGIPLKSAISGELITATVPASFYAKAGVHALHVTMKHGGTSVQSNGVQFVVQ